MAPRLFINGRFLTQQTTGVQSFARSVCAELESQIAFRILVPANAQLVDDQFKQHILRTGNFNGHLWEQIHLPSFLRKNPDSILLNLCNTGPAFVQNQGCTIHDLAFIKNPSWFHPVFARYYSWLAPRLARNSKTVFTVSETIAKEISTAFGVDMNKIHVTGNKIQSTLLSAHPSNSLIKGIKAKSFFLMVGTDDPRKNFAFAENLFKEKLQGLQLVITGGSHRSFQKTNSSETTPDIIRIGYSDEATLRWLYENAAGLINPSLYEGFGIPNLEAFAFGCPVICSDIPVFREVCEQAAIYFNPQQEADLLTAIQLCLNDAGLVAEKTSLGKVIFTSYQNKNRTQLILKALAL